MDVVPAEALQRDVIDREEAVGDGNRALWWYTYVLVLHQLAPGSRDLSQDVKRIINYYRTPS